MKKLLLSSLGLAALLSLPTAYAGDCATSFDQSCLAHRYNRRQVESDQVTREAGIIATATAQFARARAEAEVAERQSASDRIERAYQDDRYAARQERVEREQRDEKRREASDKRFDEAMDRGFLKRSAKLSWYSR